MGDCTGKMLPKVLPIQTGAEVHAVKTEGNIFPWRTNCLVPLSVYIFTFSEDLSHFSGGFSMWGPYFKIAVHSSADQNASFRKIPDLVKIKNIF